MKKAFTLLMALVAVFGMFSIFSANEATAQYVKRTLLEQHTGAWCGWCVDGTVVMDEIIKQYPDKVIGIKVHNGDGMVIPEQVEIANTLGLTGYPTGNVNRTAFNVNNTPTIFLDRGAWKQAVDAVVNNAVEAGLTSFYSYDPNTREVAVVVNVEFVKAVTGEVRLNALVVEDDVTGTGSMYDQQNYLSGRSGYEGNPYYNQPKVITGYHHMKVVRNFMGGAWGQEGSISGPTTVGKKYSYSFKYTLPTGYNPDKMYVIGVVQKYTSTNRDVLNCIKATKVEPKLQISTSGDNVQAQASGATGAITYEIKNISAAAVTVTATLTKSARTPGDWTAVMEPNSTELSLNAGETKTVTLKITPGATKGIGDATIAFLEKNNNQAIGVNGSLMVVSSEIDKFQVIDDGEAGKYSLAANISNAGYTGFFDVNSSDFNKFSSFITGTDKTIVWNSGEMGDLTGDDATAIGAMINQGANVLICGPNTIFTGNVSAKGLLSTFGIQYLKPCYQGRSTNGAINLKGYTGDPISDGFSSACQLVYYLLPAIKVTNASVASPIVRHTSVDTLAGIKAQFSGSKGVWFAFTPSIITNSTQRQNLIKKALDWLSSSSSSKGPQISVDQSSIQFDQVSTSSNKDITFTLTNTGDKDLVISTMKFDTDYDPDGVFTIKSGGALNPVTLKPGDTRDVVINFAPKAAKVYAGSLTISSNSTDDAELLVTLAGEGISVGAPKITATKSTINYNKILIGKSPIADVDITNEGVADLLITNIAITDDADGAFSILAGGEAGTLVSNASRTITVKFAPKSEKIYNANLKITSNATNSPEFVVALVGSGVTAVPEEITSPDGVVNVKVSPNPMSANGIITYNINSNDPVQFNMYIVDMNGRRVAELVKSTVTSGNYTYQLDASAINSGTYFLVAGTANSSAKLPFVITK